MAKVLQPGFSLRSGGTMSYQTVNRGKLLKAAEQGKLIGRCTANMTDDYYGDAQNNFGRTEWMPVVIDDAPAATHEGKLTMSRDEFRGPDGKAYTQDFEGDDPTVIRLRVYQGRIFELKYAE